MVPEDQVQWEWYWCLLIFAASCLMAWFTSEVYEHRDSICNKLCQTFMRCREECGWMPQLCRRRLSYALVQEQELTEELTEDESHAAATDLEEQELTEELTED